jgi:hypothetical protein
MSRKIIAAQIGYIDRSTSPISENTLYVATEGCVIDTTFYDGRLSSSISYDYRVQAPWTGLKPVNAVGSLTIANGDGELDDAYDWTFRDQEVTIKMLDPGESWADGTTLAVALVESIVFNELTAIQINLRDLAAILDAPIANDTFQDVTFHPDALGFRQPVCFGTPLNVEPVQTRASDYRYIANDEDLVAIDKVRINGEETLNYTTLAKGVQLNDAPAGQVTLDVVATGTGNILGFVVPSPEPSGITFSDNNKTVQNENRNFFSPAPPDQWSGLAGSPKSAADGGKYYFEMRVVRAVNSSANYASTYGLFLESATGIATSALDPDLFINQADQYSIGLHTGDDIVTYRDTTQVDNTDTTLTGTDGDDALFGVLVDFDNMGITFRLHQRTDPTRPLIYTSSTLAITENSPLDTFQPFGTVVGATGATDSRSQDNKITIRTQPEDFEVSIPSGYEAWDTSAYSADTQFSNLVSEITTRIPGLTVDTTSQTAIDDLGYSYSFFVKDEKPASQILAEACASFGGWYYISRTGDLTFGRLEEPGSVPVQVFTDAEVVEIRSIKFDPSPGLSDRMGARRNWTVLSQSSMSDAVSEDDRLTLSREYRHEVAQEDSTFADAYSFAIGNKILGTLFREDANANAEVERIAALFRNERKLITVDVAFEEDWFTSVTLGSTVAISNLRYNLNVSTGGAFSDAFDSGFSSGSASGKSFLVLGISGSYDRQTVRLLLWG